MRGFLFHEQQTGEPAPLRSFYTLMKILVICQFYYPEPFRITDICEELAARGHEVHVVAGTPNYPDGKNYPEYSRGRRCDETVNGVSVHRCRTVGRHHDAFMRVVNYYGYVMASKRYVSRLGDDFDVVFANQLSPVMMAEAGVRYAKKHGKRFVLYCLDLWPESLTAGGIKRGTPLFALYRWVSERIYRSADRILATSKAFPGYFADEFGINDAEYLPQYAEALFDPEVCRKKPDGNLDLMFAGNLGSVQGLDTVIRAAAETADVKNLRWHIVGDGSECGKLKKLAERLGAVNVIFHGRQPVGKMPEFYSMADAMLVTMKPGTVLSSTLPGKMQTYMAAGKPVIGAAGGEVARVIAESGCGYSVPAGDHAALAGLARRLAAGGADPEMGERGAEYCRVNFPRGGFMDRLISVLEGKDT